MKINQKNDDLPILYIIFDETNNMKSYLPASGLSLIKLIDVSTLSVSSMLLDVSVDVGT